MTQSEEFQSKGRRSPARQWLGIEFSAYVLGFLVLVTAAWKNDLVSTTALLMSWAIAGCALSLAVRGIYRDLHRPSLQNQPDRSA